MASAGAGVRCALCVGADALDCPLARVSPERVDWLLSNFDGAAPDAGVQAEWSRFVEHVVDTKLRNATTNDAHLICTSVNELCAALVTSNGKVPSRSGVRAVVHALRSGSKHTLASLSELRTPAVSRTSQHTTPSSLAVNVIRAVGDIFFSLLDSGAAALGLRADAEVAAASADPRVASKSQADHTTDDTTGLVYMPALERLATRLVEVIQSSLPPGCSIVLEREPPGCFDLRHLRSAGDVVVTASPAVEGAPEYTADIIEVTNVCDAQIPSLPQLLSERSLAECGEHARGGLSRMLNRAADGGNAESRRSLSLLYFDALLPFLLRRHHFGTAGCMVSRCRSGTLGHALCFAFAPAEGVSTIAAATASVPAADASEIGQRMAFACLREEAAQLALLICRRRTEAASARASAQQLETQRRARLGRISDAGVAAAPSGAASDGESTRLRAAALSWLRRSRVAQQEATLLQAALERDMHLLRAEESSRRMRDHLDVAGAAAAAMRELQSRLHLTPEEVEEELAAVHDALEDMGEVEALVAGVGAVRLSDPCGGDAAAPESGTEEQALLLELEQLAHAGAGTQQCAELSPHRPRAPGAAADALTTAPPVGAVAMAASATELAGKPAGVGLKAGLPLNAV